MVEKENRYDVMIIGCGPAGMTAALYASRANLKVLVLERGVPGGELLNTSDVENYPGFTAIPGPELAEKMYEGAMQFGATYAFGTVKEVKPGAPYHRILTDDGEYEAKALIIATGSTHRTLNITGEAEYAGRGVSYCAVCDGAFFKEKQLKVIGGGDSAVEEGNYLTQFSDVEIIHRRDQLRAQKILQDRAFSNEKVRFKWNSVVKSIEGDGNKVTHLTIRNVKTNEEERITADGVFIYVGLVPNNEGFLDLGITNAEGWIETDDNMMTRLPGIFACGDIRNKKLRQISTAVGDGGIAGQMAFNYIESLN